MSEAEDRDLLEEIQEKVTGVEEELETLEGVEDDVEQFRSQWKDMDDNSKETFSQRADELSADLLTAESTDDYEDISEKIEDAIEEPYRDAAISGLERVCEALGIDLASETENEIKNQFDQWSADVLGEVADSYIAVSEKLEEAADIVVDQVRDEIEGERSRYLPDPQNSLEPVVEDYVARREALEGIQEAFNEVGDWVPDSASGLADESGLYQDINEDIDSDQITDLIGKIDDRLEQARDNIPVETATRNHFEQELADPDIAELASTFSNALQSLISIEGYDDLLVNCSLIDSWRGDHSVESELLEDICAQYSDLEDGDPDSPTDLELDISRLSNDFDEWTETIARRLRQDAKTGSAITDRLEYLPELDIDADIDISSASQEDVEEDPVTALNAHEEYRDWVDEIRSQVEEHGLTEAVNAWISLEQGEELTSTQVGEDVYKELADLLGDSLVLELTEGENE